MSAFDGKAEESGSSKPAPRSWDPMDHLKDRNPSKECLKRIRKDLLALQSDPLEGIFVFPDPNYATVLHALIIGPMETPYEGGFFLFLINVPDDYPHTSPTVKLQTTGGGSVRFNPNLYANGKVCLSILGTWSGPGWSVVQNIGSICLSIQSLMNEKPIHNEPGFESASQQDSIRYNDCIRHETLRIAVLEMVNVVNTSGEDVFSTTHSMASTIPLQLQECINSLFPCFLDAYLLTARANISKDGLPMRDPFGEKRGTFYM